MNLTFTPSLDAPFSDYLHASDLIDWPHPTILTLAQNLAAPHTDPAAIAQACFEWVRDHIRHSGDCQDNPITCRASEVLQHQTGYCYAKSHLLAALLRANHLPAGFCYQRLSLNDDGAPYCLHGLNAVSLPEQGWYRIDARGNRAGIAAHFTPPQEQLAYRPHLPGERDSQRIFSAPMPIVISALQTYDRWEDFRDHLPDDPTLI